MARNADAVGPRETVNGLLTMACQMAIQAIFAASPDVCENSPMGMGRPNKYPW
jgi:hypothetical protein